jgi:hypothetical protein
MEYQDTASSFDRKFTFTDQEVGAVQAGLKTGLYNEGEDLVTRQAKWKALVTGLSSAFGIPEVGLEFHSGGTAGETGYGSYCPDSKVITVGSRFSLVTLLHFFTVALLHAKQEDPVFVAMIQGAGFGSGGEIAAAFALSLFREAAPIMYQKAKDGGKLMFFQQMEAHRSAPQPDGRSTSFEEDEAPEVRPKIKADIDPENRIRDDGRHDD